MGRGKPFKRSLDQLINAGIARKPIWYDIVNATKPPFQPVSRTSVAEITYPEDRLRNIYLQRNLGARRMPVNLKAERVSDRHISDRFVALQMQLMSERGMSEDSAYAEAERVLAEQMSEKQLELSDTDGVLDDPTIQDESARLYLASIKDARRDQAMHQALLNQSDG